MKAVSSLKNPAVQAARALRDARERARQGAFVLDGEHMVGEALSACPDRVSALFVDEGAAGGVCRAHRPRTTGGMFRRTRVCAGGHFAGQDAAGCGGGVRHAPSLAPEALGERLILLENVQDPGNVGTVLRTARCRGL